MRAALFLFSVLFCLTAFGQEFNSLKLGSEFVLERGEIDGGVIYNDGELIGMAPRVMLDPIGWLRKTCTVWDLGVFVRESDKLVLLDAREDTLHFEVQREGSDRLRQLNISCDNKTLESFQHNLGIKLKQLN